MLVDLLNNSVVLRHVAPYVPVGSLLALAGSCKALRSLIYDSDEAFRHLDLSAIKSANIDASPIDSGGISWRAERMDEALTEDDFFSGPLRGIFRKLHQRHVLCNIKTLILDGLSVPAELVREILAEDRFNVRVLSIRQVKNLNERRLQQVLLYLVRPSRAEGTPKLKALYYFGSKDASPMPVPDSPRSYRAQPLSMGILSSEGAQIGAQWNARSDTALSSSLSQPKEKWYRQAGKIMRAPSSDWAETMQACKGIIAFDSVLCPGPRHDPIQTTGDRFLRPAIANIALGSRGCETCDSAPEQPAVFGRDDDSRFPLLSPPPLHSSIVRAAQRPTMSTPDAPPPPLILRCEECLRGRWCERCNKWWCEVCYEEPVSRDNLRTELQQLELRNQLQENGWASASGQFGTGTNGPPVKVYSKLCVESCLMSEILPVADGMWG
ncbi:hypothetical protein MBLNU459_g6030t2 [Dothideomycetes sp. NU459]